AVLFSFFFSSRRRHTRSKRDWSSDVCSSDLVGTEAPWNIGKFYGNSYFVDPRGSFVAQASEDKDELVVAELDLGVIEEVRRTWRSEERRVGKECRCRWWWW